MRKYLISITAILSMILLIILLCIYYVGKLQPETPTVPAVNSDEILANGEWISLTSKDIDLLSNDNYTDNIKQIISSLENGIPVILQVNGGILDKSGTGNYITLSAFDKEGNVITYIKGKNEFQKASIDFYLALENASAAFIITNEESLSWEN